MRNGAFGATAESSVSYMLLIGVLSAWALGGALRWSAALTELGNMSVRVDQRDSS